MDFSMKFLLFILELIKKQSELNINKTRKVCLAGKQLNLNIFVWNDSRKFGHKDKNLNCGSIICVRKWLTGSHEDNYTGKGSPTSLFKM
jgi:hypothetical protein